MDDWLKIPSSGWGDYRKWGRPRFPVDPMKTEWLRRLNEPFATKLYELMAEEDGREEKAEERLELPPVPPLMVDEG